MKHMKLIVSSCMIAGLATSVGSLTAFAQDNQMSFFLTSVNQGSGGDLGGLEGADNHCQMLAESAGAGDLTWRAYLSTQGEELPDENVVHARERIGSGPWFNAEGVKIADNVDDLHSPSSNLTKQTILDEKGQEINGRTEKPNRHDILTGSRPDGTAFPGGFFPDMTCGNWTQNGDDNTAMVGHHDRIGPVDDSWAQSWNSAHPTRGCSIDAIRSTGGDGLLYCFAETQD